MFNNHALVFVAYMGWYPNQDGVEFFVTQILPTLRNLVPDVKLVVARRKPPHNFPRCLSRAGVGFNGAVADVQPLIAVPAMRVALREAVMGGESHSFVQQHSLRARGSLQ